MTSDGTDPAVDALLDAYALKDERRTGWQLRGVDGPESVAAHAWGVAYLVLTLGDRFRAELPGLDLAGPLPDRVRDAWEAYETRESPESVLVKECDLLDVCLQAVVYERDDRYDPADGDPDAFREYDDLDEFFATTEPRLQTATGRTLFTRLRDRYQAARDRE